LKKLLFGLAAMSLVGGALLAEEAKDNSFEFHGYGRAGVLVGTDGYDVESDEIPEKNMVGRLGNEPDTYWEMELVKNWKLDSGIWSKWHLMLAKGDDRYNDWIDGDIGFRQAFAEAGGFAHNKDLTYWAGKRFYNRSDIHITDFYWRDYSGTGAGVQGLRDGKWDLAYIARDVSDVIEKYDNGVLLGDDDLASHNLHAKFKPANNWEFNLLSHFIPRNQDVEITENNVVYKNSDAGEFGIQGEIVYNLPGFYGSKEGWSMLALQAGMGLGASVGGFGNLGGNEGDHGYRFVTQGGKDINDDWAILAQAWAGYESDDDYTYKSIANPTTTMNYKGADTTKASIAFRPIYKVNDNVSVQTEFGLGYTDYDAYGTADDYDGLQYKFTFAPTLHLGEDVLFGRPQLRAFVSYAGWDKDRRPSGNTDNSGEVTTGVQAEVWF